MLNSRRIIILGSVCISISLKAYAFDPITMTAMVGAGVNTINAIGDLKESTHELSSTVYALEDLFREFDEDPQIDDGSREVINRLKKIEELARELGYTENEIKYFLEYEPEKLSDGIRQLTRTIRASKKLYNAFGISKKGSEAASVYSNKIQNEQLKTQNLLLNEHRKDKLDLKIEALEKDVNWNKLIKEGNKEIKESGSKWLKSGVITFPITDKYIKAALDVAEKLKPYLLSLALLVFFTRLIYYQFTLSGSYKYNDLFFDTLSCFFLLMVFPTVIELINKFSFELSYAVTDLSSFRTIHESYIEKKFLINWSSLDIRQSMDFLVEAFKINLLFPIVKWVFSIGISLLVAIGPIIIFSSTMLNFTIGLNIYLGTLILFFLWPLFWNIIGLLAEQVVYDGLSFSGGIGALIFWFLQILSPLIVLKILQGGSLISMGESFTRGTFGASRGGASSLLDRSASFLNNTVHGFTGSTQPTVGIEPDYKHTVNTKPDGNYWSEYA